LTAILFCLAREVVAQSIASHIEAFKRWGIMAEWNSPYKTLDKNYIKTQLNSFYELYQKVKSVGRIFYKTL